MFGELQGWKHHVSNDHQVFRGWECPFCQPSVEFGKETDLLQHIKYLHSEAVTEGYLEELAAVSKVYDGPKLNICPICSVDVHDWEAEKEKFEKSGRTMKPATVPNSYTVDGTFLDHIGQCMHTFALRSLPAPLNNLKSDEIASDQSSGLMTSRSILSIHSQSSEPSDYPRLERGRGLTEAQLQSASQGNIAINPESWLDQIITSRDLPTHVVGTESEIAGFFKFVDDSVTSAVVESRPLITRPIVSLDSLRSWLTRERARSLLLYVESTPSYEDAVRTSHLAVFSVLLSINKGICLSIFIRHHHLADDGLPFLTRDAWPEAVRYMFDEFYKAQWKFCPKRLVARQLNDTFLDKNVVIPFREKLILKEGNDTVISKVEVFEEYNHLIPVGQPHARILTCTFVAIS